MEQKVIITKSDRDVNDCLNHGWRVISVTSSHVSVGGTSSRTEHGSFCFVLGRD
jgi:hypothetical protein